MKNKLFTMCASTLIFLSIILLIFNTSYGIYFTLFTVISLETFYLFSLTEEKQKLKNEINQKDKLLHESLKQYRSTKANLLNRERKDRHIIKAEKKEAMRPKTLNDLRINNELKRNKKK